MTCGGTLWLSAPFVIHIRRVWWHVGVPYGYSHLLSIRGKQAHWHAETNVVICTFCQPGASEPVDTQRLTSSSAPLSSRGGESDDIQGYLMVIRTFCHPETASPMTCGDTLWLSASFVNQGKWVWWYRDDVGRSILIILKIFAGFNFVIQRHSTPMTRKILLC